MQQAFYAPSRASDSQTFDRRPADYFLFVVKKSEIGYSIQWAADIPYASVIWVKRDTRPSVKAVWPPARRLFGCSLAGTTNA